MVLILVVVEDGLVLKSVRVSNVNGTVLILVVMEDGLVQLKQRNHGKDYFKSLNPCCNGRWSRTHGVLFEVLSSSYVLILVVMEDGLVHIFYIATNYIDYGLNPCCNGRWSRTRTI